MVILNVAHFLYGIITNTDLELFSQLSLYLTFFLNIFRFRRI